MQDGSCSSSSGKVWVKFASKAKPKLKRTQIRYNRTTAKPPHNLLAKNKSTNQCLIGWRKGPWMLTEGTLTISLFYYMQLTCALCSMKKSHVSHNDSSGSKKNGFFSFLLVNIFSNIPIFFFQAAKSEPSRTTNYTSKRKEKNRRKTWGEPSEASPICARLKSRASHCICGRWAYLCICVSLAKPARENAQKWLKP